MNQSNDNEGGEEDGISHLDSAPAEVQLAVDLIFLFESNHIDPKVALLALDIVKQDLEVKINKKA
ncbi:pleiotropic regulatory protein RsmS [Shewanella surugensis]|uniref:Pleiotropic regulatory protein RsmS n=1 Tax=Shewanella surugensis TaxID=212020 RepID=A0ABT0LBI4_9GAMM|nr:pleiotropic regulatory protein RsmS [Shewanella surugensis]MCL1125024.1 pleiotropic regulatory protein RsmS [Shewanella surugensis]